MSSASPEEDSDDSGYASGPAETSGSRPSTSQITRSSTRSPSNLPEYMHHGLMNHISQYGDIGVPRIAPLIPYFDPQTTRSRPSRGGPTSRKSKITDFLTKKGRKERKKRKQRSRAAADRVMSSMIGTTANYVSNPSTWPGNIHSPQLLVNPES